MRFAQCLQGSRNTGETAPFRGLTVVGYQNVEVPSYWSVFTPTFKDVSGKTFDLVDLRPGIMVGGVLKDIGETLTSKTSGNDRKIFIRKIDDADPNVGVYGTAFYWSFLLDGWTSNSVDVIERGAVPLADGEGFAIRNDIKMNGSYTAENYGPGSKYSPIRLRVSGEVDLVCKNAIPSYWSVTGNNTPVDLKLTDFRPFIEIGGVLKEIGETLASKTSGNDRKIFIRKIDDADPTVGVYGTAYYWSFLLNGWTIDGSVVVTPENAPSIKSGEGFAIHNDVKTNSGKTAENYGPGSKYSPIVLKVKNPITGAFND